MTFRSPECARRRLTTPAILLLLWSVAGTIGCADDWQPPPHPSALPTYDAHRQRAIAHASAADLRTALDGLAAWHAEHRTRLGASLAPPLDDARINAALHGQSLVLPDEVRALYGWHNGTIGGCLPRGDPRLLAYHCFLSLEEALAARRDDTSLYRMPDTWWPIFYYQEEYIYVIAERQAVVAAPVFHRLLESTDETLAWTNLRMLVTTYLRAATDGVWHPEDWRQIDEAAVESVRLSLNPETAPPWHVAVK